MSKDLIFGVHSVKEAILAEKSIDKIILQKGFQNDSLFEVKNLCKKHNIVTQELPLVAINKLCYGKNHQGVLAYLAPIDYQPLEEIVARTFEFGEEPFLVMLDGVTDVRNLGAIVRSAECMGANAVILPQQSSARITHDAIKTSAGAFYHLPICKEQYLKKTVLTLQSMGIAVIACTEKSEHFITDLDLKRPLCWLLGDEGRGISSSLIKMCDFTAAIPMYGQISSLNVSVAAGMVFYETQRQRNS